VVMVEEVAVEAQPLTTACRSQSSSMAWTKPVNLYLCLCYHCLWKERDRQRERERGTKQGADFWWEREKREKKQGDKGVMRGKELHKDMYI
jgi:hypothetical protein